MPRESLPGRARFAPKACRVTRVVKRYLLLLDDLAHVKRRECDLRGPVR